MRAGQRSSEPGEAGPALADRSSRAGCQASQAPTPRSPAGRAAWRGRIVRIAVNLLGAASAAFFARASMLFYLHTHQLIGAAFFVEQMWFVFAFLVRRPAQTVSDRVGSWLLAGGGTFGGLLLRPQGVHLEWAFQAGLDVQLAGVVLAVASLGALGRSFGFVAADRGVVTRGPYAVVRHPIYASYLMIQCGYLLQAVSIRNLLVLLFATGCNVGRALCEEQVLAASPAYADYRGRVRWRLVPGIW